jgi:transcriptional regulator with XRE-family HTH domain
VEAHEDHADVKPAALRKILCLSRAQLARALGVNERTVTRWEEGSAEPLGLAAEVIAGITDAINAGVDPHRVGISLTNGIRRLVCHELMHGDPR